MKEDSLNTYETIVILDPSPVYNKEEITTKIKDYIQSLSPNKIKTDVLGEKQLAYQIHGHTHGYYIIFTYKAYADSEDKITRQLRIQDEVIKFLITRNNELTFYPEDNDQSEQKYARKAPVDVFDLIFNIEEVD